MEMLPFLPGLWLASQCGKREELLRCLGNRETSPFLPVLCFYDSLLLKLQRGWQLQKIQIKDTIGFGYIITWELPFVCWGACALITRWGELHPKHPILLKNHGWRYFGSTHVQLHRKISPLVCYSAGLCFLSSSVTQSTNSHHQLHSCGVRVISRKAGEVCGPICCIPLALEQENLLWT